MNAEENIRALQEENAQLRDWHLSRDAEDEAAGVVCDHWRVEALKARNEACVLAGRLRDLLNCGNDECRENAKSALIQHDRGQYHK